MGNSVIRKREGSFCRLKRNEEIQFPGDDWPIQSVVTIMEFFGNVFPFFHANWKAIVFVDR